MITTLPPPLSPPSPPLHLRVFKANSVKLITDEFTQPLNRFKFETISAVICTRFQQIPADSGRFWRIFDSIRLETADKMELLTFFFFFLGFFEDFAGLWWFNGRFNTPKHKQTKQTKLIAVLNKTENGENRRIANGGAGAKRHRRPFFYDYYSFKNSYLWVDWDWITNKNWNKTENSVKRKMDFWLFGLWWRRWRHRSA